ncbi:MAG: hypothetical protein ACP5XB_25590, partial [Isosphaeraceae bacterium]
EVVTKAGQLVQLLARMRQAAAATDELSVATGLTHFLKVTKSYWPGLFKCYLKKGRDLTRPGERDDLFDILVRQYLRKRRHEQLVKSRW